MKIFFISLFLLFICFKTFAQDIQILEIKSGNGNKIVNHSKITVHYSGKLLDGTEFDNSYKRNKPFTFQIGMRQVIEGWEISLMGKKEGAKLTIQIPPELGYGKQKVGNIIPSNSTLIFNIEIIEVASPGYSQLKVNQIKEKQKKGFIFIDIRNKDQIKKTGLIPGSINIQAFNKNGKLLNKFLQEYKTIVTNLDNVVLISERGDISSILANGFVEHLGSKNMYSLKGGIQEYLNSKKIKLLR